MSSRSVFLLVKLSTICNNMSRFNLLYCQQSTIIQSVDHGSQEMVQLLAIFSPVKRLADPSQNETCKLDDLVFGDFSTCFYWSNVS